MELPETAIAPVIDTRPPAKAGSLDSFELAADLEPEPVAPPPPPRAAAPKPAAPPKPPARSTEAASCSTKAVRGYAEAARRCTEASRSPSGRGGSGF